MTKVSQQDVKRSTLLVCMDTRSFIGFRYEKNNLKSRRLHNQKANTDMSFVPSKDVFRIYKTFVSCLLYKAMQCIT